MLQEVLLGHLDIMDKMKNPALKREVSLTKKMLKLTNPRLRRFNVVVNSFGSCVADTSKEFSRTPEMSVSEMPSKPRMFFEKLKSAITFKQLQGFANTHSWGKLNKQVDMVDANIEFINFEPFSVSNLPQEKLTIHPQPIELEGIFSIFNFPDKMESILSKTMFSGFQIHFSSPKPAGDSAHANFTFYFEEPSIQALPNSQTKELNFEVNGDSSPNLKVWVSSPWM